ncbi:MAG: PqqD family protein [Bacteroidales bacterium]|nr:PqqD family protein [Bacteroidales bacterium]MBR4677681.1 PqqD family protein [Bacteroidales bacterium]
MKLKKGFVVREVCAQKVIVAEGLEAVDFGRLLSLNDSAAFVWQLAEKQGDFTVESLAAEFCKEYDTDEKTAQNDIRELLEKWQKTGVVE